MIGELFIDRCIQASIGIPDEYHMRKKVFDNLDYIYKWYQNEIDKNDIEVNFFEKFQLARYLNNYRKEVKSYSYNKLREILLSGKYKRFVETLDVKKIDYTEEQCDEFYNYICKKKKLCQLLSGKIDLQKILNNIESGNYEDEDEIIDEWMENINVLYSNLMDSKKEDLVNEVSQLDLLNDDYSSVVDKIKETLNSDMSVKTGFNFLEKNLPTKGLEQRRLYLIGGTSGVGKSNFLINLIRNAITNNKTKEKQTYIYITAENLIDESLLRFYCCLTGKSYDSVIKKIMAEGNYDFKSEIKSILEEHNTNVLFYYIQGSTNKVRDIELLVDDAKNRYDDVKGLFIDYLDLLNPNKSTNDTRLDLGNVASELKDIGINYSIPVITVTQLNRQGYERDSKPSLTQMSESMLKINTSDVVMFLQNAKNDILTDSSGRRYKIQVLSLLKNRNGPAGDYCSLRVLDKLSGKSVFNYRFEEYTDEEDEQIMDNGEEDNSNLYNQALSDDGLGMW